MPVPSQPPPSDKVPEKSGGSLYLLGAVALVGAAVALYFWKRPAPPITPQTNAVTVTATATATEAPVAMFAPPPPPKLDDDADAGADAGKAPTKSSSGGGAVSPGPCGGACSGGGTPALRSALSAKAGSARGCYQRALRTSEVSGSMTVRVQVGPSGQVCSASLTNDTVHSNEVSSCVLGRFRGSSFPAPGECTTVDIPISFTIKQ